MVKTWKHSITGYKPWLIFHVGNLLALALRFLIILWDTLKQIPQYELPHNLRSIEWEFLSKLIKRCIPCNAQMLEDTHTHIYTHIFLYIYIYIHMLYVYQHICIFICIDNSNIQSPQSELRRVLRTTEASQAPTVPPPFTFHWARMVFMACGWCGISMG